MQFVDSSISLFHSAPTPSSTDPSVDAGQSFSLQRLLANIDADGRNGGPFVGFVVGLALVTPIWSLLAVTTWALLF